jgi:hypothetical protein
MDGQFEYRHGGPVFIPGSNHQRRAGEHRHQHHERHEAGDEQIERLWDDVAPFLSSDRGMHSNLIEHWSLPGEPLEDAFALTARIRSLIGPREV